MPELVKFWIFETEDFDGSIVAGFKGAKGPLLMTKGFGNRLDDCRLFWNHIYDQSVPLKMRIWDEGDVDEGDTCTALPSMPVCRAMLSLTSLEGFSFSRKAISRTSSSRALVFRRRRLTSPGLSIMAFSSGFSG